MIQWKKMSLEEAIMSIDALQNKIRKKKNPSAVVLAPNRGMVPGGREAGEYLCALLAGLKDLVPAVRLDPAAFWMAGCGDALGSVLEKARELGYYVILDWTRMESPNDAKESAERILKEECWPCDAVVVSGYAGTDAVKHWFKAAGKTRDVYVVVKTANKSGSELQDLQTGGRFVYTAAADLISRMGDSAMDRCGYSRLAVMAGAYNGNSLKTLREKYPKLFLLVDGLDESGCNARNASFAFDRLGHGALVCAGASIVGAWKETESCEDPVAAAVEAAERMKRNVTRYVNVL